MRRMNFKNMPESAQTLILDAQPLSEDIGIFDEEGNLTAVIIKPKVYQYLLRKIEEDEERLDMNELKGRNRDEELESAMDIDDFIKSMGK